MAKNPAITLPYLIDGDKVITESNGVAVYLCHKGNKVELLGRNAEEQVALATVHGVFKDLHLNYIKLVYGKYDENNTFEKAKTESYGSWKVQLAKLNGILGDKHFIAGEITWIDFAIADFFQTLGLLDAEYLKDFPKLAALQQRVWALPELQAYYSSTRWNERPCNGSIAHWK